MSDFETTNHETVLQSPSKSSLNIINSTLHAQLPRNDDKSMPQNLENVSSLTKNKKDEKSQNKQIMFNSTLPGNRSDSNSNSLSNDNINHSYINNYDLVDINTYYSMHPNTIPPFVIDRLIKTYSGHTSSLADPFTSSFKNNGLDLVQWDEFLNSIKSIHSDVPVKLYSNGQLKDIDEMNDYNDDIQSCNGSLNTINKQDLAKDIFKEYNLTSTWKGGKRLKGLFESPDDPISDNCSDSDTSAVTDSSDLDNNNNQENTSNDNVDLEKGLSSRKRKLRRHYRHRKHRFNIRRRNIEYDIKQRARYWIQENKKDWRPKLLESLRINSYFPLFFRLISLSLTTVALGLSIKLVVSTHNNHVNQQPSPLMALIVQAIAIVYLVYITYDEFTSQPLGLRNPREKIKLILLDLVFIIFSSANLSLSFQSIYDSRWVCAANLYPGDLLSNPRMCKHVKALTAFLLVTLIVWCINFSISVFRIVHVVSYTRNKS